MSDDAANPRPSISSVDARVGRLEMAQTELANKQIEQDGVMRLIQLEQQHIREIMTSRFVGLEGLMQVQGSKLDNFIGKMETLISEGMKQSTELEASPLGRQVDARLKRAEEWVETSKEFHAEQAGMRKLVVALTGTSAIGFMAALAALGKVMGIL